MPRPSSAAARLPNTICGERWTSTEAKWSPASRPFLRFHTIFSIVFIHLSTIFHDVLTKFSSFSILFPLFSSFPSSISLLCSAAAQNCSS